MKAEDVIAALRDIGMGELGEEVQESVGKRNGIKRKRQSSAAQSASLAVPEPLASPVVMPDAVPSSATGVPVTVPPSPVAPAASDAVTAVASVS